MLPMTALCTHSVEVTTLAALATVKRKDSNRWKEAKPKWRWGRVVFLGTASNPAASLQASCLGKVAEKNAKK